MLNKIIKYIEYLFNKMQMYLNATELLSFRILFLSSTND